MITNGQIPILTFLQSPSSVFGSSVCGQMYPNSMPCCCRHEARCAPNPYPVVHERRSSRKANYLQPDSKVSFFVTTIVDTFAEWIDRILISLFVWKVRSKCRNRSVPKKERRSSLPTAEEVAKTYTGLDREMAEEFIAIAMDKGPRRSRNNSFTEYGIDSQDRRAY